MPYLTIPQLPSGVAPLGNEPFESVQNGFSVQLSLNQLASFFGSQAGSVSSINGLSGIINISGFDPLSVTNNNNIIQISGNFSNYILNSQTGIFLTTGQSGLFIPNATLSSLVTTSQTGIFATSSQLSSYLLLSQSGLFYPATNPSGFITSTQTGQFASLVAQQNDAINIASINTVSGTFLTSGNAASTYYPKTNPSGFVTVTQTGVLQPSGNYLLNGQSGSFSSVSTNYVQSSGALLIVTGISGSAFFTQPERGSSYKKVLVYLSGLIGAAPFTFPVAFTNAPVVLVVGGPNTVPSTTAVTSLSVSGVTVSGSNTTGYLIIEGF